MAAKLARVRQLDSLDGTQCVQSSFAQMGTPLSEATFVVVDLETTGMGAGAAITEIGAVKVLSGAVEGEFSTLVNPAQFIPPKITALTGITNAAVARAPRLAEAFGAFLEFAGLSSSTVLVAHNASFDVGFLKRAAAQLGYAWPNPLVLDTLALARMLLPRPQVKNHKLSTLAGLFSKAAPPDHRALTDARATVDVLYGLLEKAAPAGLTHLEDIATFSAPIPLKRRRKVRLTKDIPARAGVYYFRAQNGDVLYIGSSKNLRARTRSYFTASEGRGRIREMLDIAASLTYTPTVSEHQARILELEEIDRYKPPYNRASRNQKRHWWVELTQEAVPRLKVTRVPKGVRLGPFSSKKRASASALAICRASRIRQCALPLRKVDTPYHKDCYLAQTGGCSAPCHGFTEADEIACADAKELLNGHLASLVEASLETIGDLSAAEEFEAAALERDHLKALLDGAFADLWTRPVRVCPKIIAARKLPKGGWEILGLSYGMVVATAQSAPAASPLPTIETLEECWPDVPSCRAFSREELIANSKWLLSAPTRIIVWQGTQTDPAAWHVDGVGRYLDLYNKLKLATS
ncbi:DEDD exonuclease domain-containing protein [Winkia neuii]|uniref:DEDD exonuclease domain-containing protein n=1 Tax=Winkia neuii TaxID=33007 RepID=UPI0025524989|nr:DEDD exonuclease domain-containing protein [Winkia neuii]